MTWSHFDLRELASGRVVTPPPLFHNFLLDRTITMLTAPPYTGKSLFLAHLAICLDTCRPLLNKYPAREVLRPLCILQDAPTWDYAEQFRKLLRGAQLGREIVEQLETQLVINEGIQLTDPDFRDQLLAWKENHRFDVLILDALWTLHPFDENNASQMAHVARTLKWIRDKLGVAIIFSHHERKMNALDSKVMSANDRARGSSVLSAAVDFQLTLTRRGNNILITTGKARGMSEDDTRFTISDVDHPHGPAVTLEALPSELSAADRIRIYLIAPRKRSEIEDFARALAGGAASKTRLRNFVDSNLRLLSQRGLIERSGYGTWKATISGGADVQTIPKVTRTNRPSKVGQD